VDVCQRLPWFKAASVALLATVLLAACEEERRVPYIRPELHNWPRPYKGVTGLSVRVFVSGFVRLPEVAGSRQRWPVLVYLISHPKRGLVVFNTGLSPDTDAQEPGGALFGGLQPKVEPGEPMADQMRKAKISPERVQVVILGNLRPAQRGNLGLFKAARVVVSAAELTAAREREPDAVAEIEGDHSIEAVDFEPVVPLGTFAAHHDLFGDGSCLLIDARGASPGTMALLLRLRDRALLLADALAPTSRTLRYAARPGSLEDADAWWGNIWRLKRFADLAPEILVVPQTGLEVLESAGLRSVTVQPYEAPPTLAPPTPTKAGWMPAMPR
jgi:hypothetical protein